MRNIPMMLCCNDPDHGVFTGEMVGIEFGDDSETLCLEPRFWDWGPPIRYITAQRTQVALEFLVDGEDWDRGQTFRVPFVQGSWCDHVGNWCWDRALLAPDVALALLNWLKRQRKAGEPWFGPHVGEETLWKVWESEAVDFTRSDLRIITGESVNNKSVNN